MNRSLNNNNDNNNHNKDMKNNGISLATPPAIHVGPIITPGSNEAISIVIPLSAQLATVSNHKVEKPPCKDCGKDSKEQEQQQSLIRSTSTKIRNDKTKGCPYPTCVRYGRAFSRAHDLKRHIARHEMRKEKLITDSERQIALSMEYNKNLANEVVARPDLQVKFDNHPRDSGKTYSCPHCRKKYVEENKLRAHLAMHDKQMGMRGGGDAAAMQNREDIFLMEEMLLLHKNPRREALEKMNEATSGKAISKIRCDYCQKTFKTKWTLSSHVAAHEGRYQFDCAQCGKRFVRKSHYEGHVRSHEAARPYACEQCGKTFKELKHRREHTKRKHPGSSSAIQTLLDSIGPCASEEMPVDQTKLTLLMPMTLNSLMSAK